jgi:hypothetical protein
MNSQHRIPTALSILSYLFLVYGLWSAIIQITQLYFALRGYGLGIHPEIISIWVFAGLRRRSPAWRICALVLIWLAILVPLLGLGYALVVGQPVLVNGWHQQYFISPLASAALVMPWLLLSIWAYRVLTRPDIRALFCEDGDQAQPITGKNAA